jgi:hypothetical protein
MAGSCCLDYNTLKNTKDFETILHNLRQIFTSVSQQVFAQAETPNDGLQSSTETEVEAKNKCNISGLTNSCSQAATSTLTVGALGG